MGWWRDLRARHCGRHKHRPHARWNPSALPRPQVKALPAIRGVSGEMRDDRVPRYEKMEKMHRALAVPANPGSSSSTSNGSRQAQGLRQPCLPFCWTQPK
jgi:hypothetical protein